MMSRSYSPASQAQGKLADTGAQENVTPKLDERIGDRGMKSFAGALPSRPENFAFTSKLCRKIDSGLIRRDALHGLNKAAITSNSH